MPSLKTPLLSLLLALPLLGAAQDDDPFGELYGERRAGKGDELPAEPLPRAVAFIGRGRHDEAEALLQRLRREAPRAVAPLVPLARLYLKTGRDAEAVTCAQRLLELDPQRAAGRLFLAIAAERRGELEAALEGYTKAIELGLRQRPFGLEALTRRAVLLSEIDAERAQRDLRDVLAYYQGHDELSPAELTWVARGCRVIEYFPALEAEYQQSFVKYARTMLDQALAKDPEFGPALREGGRLALIKFNHPLAKKSYERVVARDPNDADARVGLARTLLESFYGGAGKYEDAADNLKKALSADPYHPGAHATLARIAALDGDHEAALERVATGLRGRPGDVELLAARAAVHLLRGQQDLFEQDAKQVLAGRPRCARFFIDVATLVQMKFRYAEARDLARRALELDPGYSPALAVLGVNLTRTGEEEEGRRVLKKAFEQDPYDVFVFNHLQLWDRLDAKYVTVPIPGGLLRLDKEEQAVTARYAAALVAEARERLAKRYGGVPERVLIELFSQHADFSARSVGLPGIPALGVCFGPVVTVLSSKEKKAFGAHSWGRTLWHEYTHVCTLTRTRNRIPRWLTEGLSVYEEPHGRPTWVRNYDRDVMTMMARGWILPVAQLDEGFTKPRYPNQVMMSYYQGGMMCDFIEARWGFEKILALLDAFREGLDTRAALGRALGLTAEDFDRRFYRYLERRYAPYAWRPAPTLEDRAALSARLAAAPWDVGARGELAWTLALHGEDADAANQAGLALQHAAALQDAMGALAAAEPAAPGVGARLVGRALSARAGAADAHLALGFVWGRAGKLSKAARSIRRALDLGTRDPVRAHLLLSDVAKARQDWARATAELEAARALSPPDPDLLRKLAALRHQAKDEAGEMAALREVCRTDSEDAGARLRYARWAAKQDRWNEVAEVLDDVNLIDPFLKDTHVLLGDALRKTALGERKLYERALVEYEVAEKLGVDYKAAAYYGAAACLKELGKLDEAKALVRKALQDDPEHQEARRLRLELGD
ncbi:MAG: tetratricopeptide repeat protein [Planctomycetota bacterium]